MMYSKLTIVAVVSGCVQLALADGDTQGTYVAGSDFSGPGINSECNQDPDCKDCDARCDEWAAAGHCNEDPPTCGGVGSPPCSPADSPEAYPNWMKVNCEVSCDSCTSVEAKVTKAPTPADNCATWAAAGECGNNAAYMGANCAAACAAANPSLQSGSLAATLGNYPGTTGSGVTGAVTATIGTDGVIHFDYDMAGLEVSAGGGIHIHTGTSCDDAAAVGGHYYSPDLEADPWTTKYTSDSVGAAKSSAKISAGYGYAANLGHAVVVHASDGSRVACGVLVAPSLKITVTQDTGKSSKGDKSKRGKGKGKGKGGKGKSPHPQSLMQSPLAFSSAGAGMGVAAAGLIGLVVVGVITRKSWKAIKGYTAIEPVETFSVV